MIYEEDLEDLIVDEEEEENQYYQIGTEMQENTSQSLKKPHKHYDFAETEASHPEQNQAYNSAAEFANLELIFKNWNHLHAQSLIPNSSEIIAHYWL